MKELLSILIPFDRPGFELRAALFPCLLASCGRCVKVTQGKEKENLSGFAQS
jgi:hypothetical protein